MQGEVEVGDGFGVVEIGSELPRVGRWPVLRWRGDWCSYMEDGGGQIGNRTAKPMMELERKGGDRHHGESVTRSNGKEGAQSRRGFRSGAEGELGSCQNRQFDGSNQGPVVVIEDVDKSSRLAVLSVGMVALDLIGKSAGWTFRGGAHDSKGGWACIEWRGSGDWECV